MAMLEAEADNLRAALGWAEEHGKGETGLRLGLAFGVLAMQRGTPAEGWEWLQRVQALGGGDPLLQARALTALGWFALYQGDTDGGHGRGRASGRDRRGRVLGPGECPAPTGQRRARPGTTEAARRRFEEARVLVEDHVEAGVWAPPILMNLGLLATIQGDVVAARRWYEATLAALPADAVTFIRPMVLGHLASIAWNEGDRSRAAELQREALPLRQALWDVLALASSLANAAEFAALGGRLEVAARLLGAAEALRLRGAVAIDPFNLGDPDALKRGFGSSSANPRSPRPGHRGRACRWTRRSPRGMPCSRRLAQDDSGERKVTDRPAH